MRRRKKRDPQNPQGTLSVPPSRLRPPPSQKENIEPRTLPLDPLENGPEIAPPPPGKDSGRKNSSQGSKCQESSAGEFLLQNLGELGGIRLPPGRLHRLSDEKCKKLVAPGPVVGDLGRIVRDDLVDDFLQRA